MMVEVPKLRIQEMSYEDLLKIESERGLGALGSSGKQKIVKKPTCRYQSKSGFFLITINLR